MNLQHRIRYCTRIQGAEYKLKSERWEGRTGYGLLSMRRDDIILCTSSEPCVFYTQGAKPLTSCYARLWSVEAKWIRNEGYERKRRENLPWIYLNKYKFYTREYISPHYRASYEADWTDAEETVDCSYQVTVVVSLLRIGWWKTMG